MRSLNSLVINGGAGLNRGLRFWGVAPEAGSRGKVIDLVGKNTLTLRQGATILGNAPVNSPTMSHLRCDAATEGATASANKHVYGMGWPISIGVDVWYLGSPSQYAAIMAVTYDNTSNAPYDQYSIFYNAAVQIGWNSAGTFNSTSTGLLYTDLQNAWYRLLIVITGSNQKCYKNGTLVTSASNSLSAPTSGTAPYIVMGAKPADDPSSRNSNVLLANMKIWTRDMSDYAMLEYKAMRSGSFNELVQLRAKGAAAQAAVAATRSDLLLVGVGA